MEDADVISILVEMYKGDENIFPPATAEIVSASEAALGFPLPPLLRRLYTQVGNGGMGPLQGGIIGLYEGRIVHGMALPEVYNEFRDFSEEPFLFENVNSYQWPDKLVPFCLWSGHMYSCVLCNSPEAPVYALNFDFIDSGDAYIEQDDPIVAGISYPIKKEASSLEEWLRHWAKGDDLWKNAIDITTVDIASLM